MILSDGEIEEAIRRKLIVIDPPPSEEQYATSALDLHLGEELWELKSREELAGEDPVGIERNLVVNLSTVDVRHLVQKYAKPVLKQPDGSFLLEPAKFLLGITHEYIDLPRKSKIAARVEGRSTPARLGLVVHFTAPTIHAGFSGKIVLEMYNFGNYPLRIFPGRVAVCQLIFERLGRTPKGPLRTKYLCQRSVAAKQP